MYQFLATSKEDGNVVFPPKLLSPLLGLLEEDQILLELQEQNLVVQSGGYHTTIKALDAEEFPIIPSFKGDEPSVEVETGAFCRGMSQVVGMVGQSQTRPEISGVFFVFGK